MRVFLVVLLFLLISCAQAPVETPAVEQEVLREHSAVERFQELMNRRADAYAVEYALEITGPQPTAGLLSVAVEKYVGDKYENYATRMSLAGVESAVFLRDGAGFRCINAGSWSCFSLPEAQIAALHTTPGSQSVVENNPAAYVTEYAGSRVLLDEPVECFETVLTPESPIITEYCYAADGIPLLIRTAAGSVSSELRATSVSRVLPGGVFELPVPLAPELPLPVQPPALPPPADLIQIPEIPLIPLPVIE